MFRIMQSRAMSALLCGTLVLDITGWFAFLSSKADGDFLPGWEKPSQLGCEGLRKGLMAVHGLCT